MSVRSFQQIADEAESLKLYKVRYVGPDYEGSGFTVGKVYEVKGDPYNVPYLSAALHFVEVVDDDGYDRCRPSDEFKKVE